MDFNGKIAKCASSGWLSMKRENTDEAEPSSSASPPFPNGHRVQHDPQPGRRLLHCPQCSFVAARPSHLKIHQRIHSGERPHQCSHCGKAFVQKGNLVTHLRLHAGFTIPSPSVDGRSWQHRPQPGHRLLRCQQCNFMASRPSHLKRQRPHQCSHCGKAFMRKGHLVNRLRLHSGERPFRCHLCCMTFTQKSALARHLRSHTAKRSFQ
ncbi:uncharacterized protein LOC144166328 isoform X1 [Haemaphysalis longicornis]